MKFIVKNSSKDKRGFLLLFSVFMVAVFGCIMVHSASCYVAELDYKDAFYFTKKQIFGVVVGSVFMVTSYFLDLSFLKKYAWVIYLVSIVLLALCFLPFLSVEIYGARRWLNLGLVTLQPSEIAKFAYIIWVARYFSMKPERVNGFKGIILPILLGGIVCLLIILEPNMSITMCVALLMISLLYVSGVKIQYIIAVLIPVILMVPILILLEPYRLLRLSAFLNPWQSAKGEGYQLIQSLYGLGSGGLFGVGLFRSRQKFKFLPFAESDFILSIIGEELGFVGILFLFLVFFIIIYLSFSIAIKAPNYFGYIYAMGVGLIFLIQVVINALVVSGSMPPTGLPLPLISAGNTSIIVYMTAFGFLASLSKSTSPSLTKKAKIS